MKSAHTFVIVLYSKRLLSTRWREKILHIFAHVKSNDLGSIPASSRILYQRQLDLFPHSASPVGDRFSQARRRIVRFFLRHSIRSYIRCWNYIAKALRGATARARLRLERIRARMSAVRAFARATPRFKLCVRTNKSSNMYKIGSTLSPQAGWIYYCSVSAKILKCKSI